MAILILTEPTINENSLRLLPSNKNEIEISLLDDMRQTLLFIRRAKVRNKLSNPP